MKENEIEEKTTEIVLQKGKARINRNRMLTLSLGCTLVDWYAMNHFESPTTDQKTFMASMGVVIVVSFVQSLIDHHRMNLLEEEYQEIQSKPCQKTKTFPVKKL